MSGSSASEPGRRGKNAAVAKDTDSRAPFNLVLSRIEPELIVRFEALACARGASSPTPRGPSHDDEGERAHDDDRHDTRKQASRPAQSAAPPTQLLDGNSITTEWDRLSTRSRGEVEQFIEVLKAMKQGDFTVRFESDKDGVLGRAGELLNDIIGLNEHMSGELVRVGKVVGQEGKMHERASVGPAKGSWATGMASRQSAHRRPRRADERGRARHHRRRPRRPLAEDGPRDRGAPGARRVPPHRHDRQQHGRSAQLVRRRGHARREGGRQRRKARRPGRRQGRLRHVEGPDRQRQRPRRQPDRPGAQHREGDDRRRQGRPLAEDHRRRARARSSS